MTSPRGRARPVGVSRGVFFRVETNDDKSRLGICSIGRSIVAGRSRDACMSLIFIIAKWTGSIGVSGSGSGDGDLVAMEVGPMRGEWGLGWRCSGGGYSTGTGGGRG